MALTSTLYGTGATMTDKTKTAAGAEAAEGIHSADRPRTEEKSTSLENTEDWLTG
jgi:hypothetical protein